jgi:MYXO-CTERM domain-containing protein
MHSLKALLLSLPLSMMVLSQARDASACGGCLIQQQQESTQVTGHKMILSVSKTQTTLWDQITYSGNPSSFGWVLPIKGTVEFALSSDALFQALDTISKVSISSPSILCPPPPICRGESSSRSGSATSGGSGGGAPPVVVLAQDVVGPFEMVQLQATDSSALRNWLSMHNFNLPADIDPIVEAYVTEGFNFLALKLLPDQGISSMRPVRVTTQGASPVLPLRMVAAGTGAITPITLWVLGEGRYEPASLPTFTIKESQLVWNWKTQSSNYAALQKAAFESSQGKAWQTETAEPFNKQSIVGQLQNLVQYNPERSGYTGDKDLTTQQALDADMADLFDGINATSLWFTRLHSELSRAALAEDLQLNASTNQAPVSRFLTAYQTTEPFPCPSYSPCVHDTGSDGSGGSGGSSGNGSNSSSSSSCAMTDDGSSPALFGGLALGIALTLAQLRRRRR